MHRVESYYCNIWIAGDYDDARRVCKAFCASEGACVTVTKTSFVYTGGEEFGVCVRLVNYPRFPAADAAIWEKAWRLAELLRDGLYQESVLIEAPDQTVWVTSRHHAS